MQIAETRKLDMLERVANFCAVEHAADFPAGTRGGALAQTIKQTVAELNEHAGRQAAAKRQAEASADSKEAARKALRAALEQIRNTARGMDRDTPGTAAKFKLPARSDEALAAAARAFHTNAGPLKDDFIKNELPANFLEQLQQHLADFERTAADLDTHANQQVAATATINALLAQGGSAVRQLDPIVRNKFRADAAALAAWASASHVERAPKRRQTGAAADKPPAQQ